MFERFTVEARDAVIRAQQTALVLRHTSIDTEHELLGLIDVRAQIVSDVFVDAGIETRLVRGLLQERLTARPKDAFEGLPVFSPSAKEALSMSLREMLSLKHRDVGPEHVLLGILRVERGGAVEVLRSAGADVGEIRSAVIERVGSAGR